MGLWKEDRNGRGNSFSSQALMQWVESTQFSLVWVIFSPGSPGDA